MQVWRIKLNSAMGESDEWDGPREEFWDAQKKYCRENGVVGVGWGRPEWLGISGKPTLEEVLAAIASSDNPAWKNGPGTVRMLAGMQPGDLVWTRDSSGTYWLGRVAKGGWRWDTSNQASKWDLNNVQPCAWLEDAFEAYRVPGSVVRSFTGTGSTLRRVAPGTKEGWQMTEAMYRKKSDPGYQFPTPELSEIITALLDPTDVEDLALSYLQVAGWSLLPSSRSRDMVLYEAALINRETGEMAVVAVKSGEGNQVPVKDVVGAVPEAKAFVCSTHDNFSEDPESVGATAITQGDLVKFMRDRRKILPPRVAFWLGGAT